MSPTDRSEYLKLAAELAGIATRLKELSDAGFSDMEGADAQEFRVSEILYADLGPPSEMIAKASLAITKELE